MKNWTHYYGFYDDLLTKYCGTMDGTDYRVHEKLFALLWKLSIDPVKKEV